MISREGKIHEGRKTSRIEMVYLLQGHLIQTIKTIPDYLSTLIFHPFLFGWRKTDKTSLSIYILLFTSPFIIFWPYFSDWFYLVDDGLVLQQAVLYSPVQYFTQPHVYRLISHANLTPLLTLSFDFDYSLFGVHPVPFRIHQFVSLGLVTVLSFYLLRRFRVPKLLSILGIFLFLSIAPVCDVADRLSARQYIEGLVLALVCLVAFLNSINRDHRKSWLVVALLFYAIATTAKEIYVPLPLVLFALVPGSDIAKRLRRILPFLLITLTYVGYRFYMLGGIAGYQGSSPHVLTQGAYLDASTYLYLFNVPKYIFTTTWLTWTVFALSACVLIVSTLRRWTNWWLLLCAVITLLIPLVAVAPQIALWGSGNSLRWYMLFGWGVCILLPTGIACINRQRVRVMFACFLALILALSLWQVTIPRLANHPTYGSHWAKAIWKADDTQVVYESKPFFYSPSDSVWRYLAYLVKGTPGTFVVRNKWILHWLPQTGKSAITFRNGNMHSVSLSPGELKTLSRSKSEAIFKAMRVQDGVLHFDCSGGGRRVLFLIDKPFYVHHPYSCIWNPTFILRHVARGTGIRLQNAYMVVGEYLDGEWRFTMPVKYSRTEMYEGRKNSDLLKNNLPGF